MWSLQIRSGELLAGMVSVETLVPGGGGPNKSLPSGLEAAGCFWGIWKGHGHSQVLRSQDLVVFAMCLLLPRLLSEIV